MDAAAPARVPDIEAIRGLMTGWIHRDSGNRAELLELFHPDATIGVTWFSGLAREFVEGSRRWANRPSGQSISSLILL
jgi:hypothetical protein